MPPRLGLLLWDGVAQDYAQAIKWLRKAADQNLAVAQFMLGHCYEYGQGVAKDRVEAVRWYRKAAEQNDAGAQFSLGVCYDEGQGVAKDKVEAMKWYRKAAEQNADAQCYLGRDCYHDGDGVKKDAAEAVKWYRKAAEQNFAKGSIQSGRLLLRWQGPGTGLRGSLQMVSQGRRTELRQCSIQPRLCYGKGQGVPQNDVEAYFWSSLAAAQDVKNATHNRDILAFAYVPRGNC